MKKLLNIYSLADAHEYYELIAESVSNGQRTQAVEQFKEMPEKYRKEFLCQMMDGEFDHSIGTPDKHLFIWA